MHIQLHTSWLWSTRVEISLRWESWKRVRCIAYAIKLVSRGHGVNGDDQPVGGLKASLAQSDPNALPSVAGSIDYILYSSFYQFYSSPTRHWPCIIGVYSTTFEI